MYVTNANDTDTLTVIFNRHQQGGSGESLHNSLHRKHLSVGALDGGGLGALVVDPRTRLSGLRKIANKTGKYDMFKTKKEALQSLLCKLMPKDKLPYTCVGHHCLTQPSANGVNKFLLGV